MYFQIPNISAILFFVVILFFIGGINYASYLAIKFITSQIRNPHKKNIKLNLIVIISISLWWNILRLAISFKILYFSNPTTELHINIIIGIIYGLLILRTLQITLKATHPIEESNEINIKKEND